NVAEHGRRGGLERVTDMLWIGERVRQEEPTGLFFGSGRLCIGSSFGKGGERFSDAGENFSGARRKCWLAVALLSEFNVDWIAAIVQDARHDVQRECQPLA